MCRKFSVLTGLGSPPKSGFPTRLTSHPIDEVGSVWEDAKVSIVENSYALLDYISAEQALALLNSRIDGEDKFKDVNILFQFADHHHFSVYTNSTRMMGKTDFWGGLPVRGYDMSVIRFPNLYVRPPRERPIKLWLTGQVFVCPPDHPEEKSGKGIPWYAMVDELPHPEFKPAEIVEFAKYLRTELPFITQEAIAEPKKQPQRKGPQQEAAILGCLKDLGHDPQALPPRENGMPWVKLDVWGQLSGASQLFGSKGAFDSSWKRLRELGEIREAGGGGQK